MSEFKVLCPNCQKEIERQAEVEILNSTTPVDFESIVVCPHCRERFCVDIWLPTSIAEIYKEIENEGVES